MPVALGTNGGINMRTIALTLALLLATTSAQADDKGNADLAATLKDADGMAKTFASCEGFFTFMADFSRNNGQPASADYLKTFANGSRTAALWLLSAKYQLDNPDLPGRRLGDFAQLIDGPAETERLRFAALAEVGDMEPIEEQSQLCKDMLAAFDPILQQFRQQFLGPDAAQPSSEGG